MNSDSNTTTRQWLDDLEKALAEQKQLLDELASLAARQSQHIENGQAEALLDILASRQRVVDRFVKSQDQVNTLAGDLDQHADALSAAQRAELQANIDSISARLAEVMSRDAGDQEKLQTHLHSARAAQQSLGTARQAAHAYTQRGKTNRFADQRG